jgi:NAD(P)-dependent dehydrogenase (short-subunit alcohol dehydrogenase family)
MACCRLWYRGCAAPARRRHRGYAAQRLQIADVVAFLASDEARYIAGETVEIMGAKPGES